MSASRRLAARFAGPILEGHKGCAIEVPFDPKERWGASPIALRPGRRGHRVEARIGPQTFATAVVARSRRFWMLLAPEILEKARLGPGDTVSVEVRPVGAAGPR